MFIMIFQATAFAADSNENGRIIATGVTADGVHFIVKEHMTEVPDPKRRGYVDIFRRVTVEFFGFPSAAAAKSFVPPATRYESFRDSYGIQYQGTLYRTYYRWTEMHPTMVYAEYEGYLRSRA